MTTRQAARTAPFWMMMITGVAIASGFYIVAAHIVPAATDVGISPHRRRADPHREQHRRHPGDGGRSLVADQEAGPPADADRALRRSRPRRSSCFVVTSSLWAFYVVAVLLGFCFSASTPVRQAMAPPLFGLRSIGAVLGYAYLAWSVGAVAGPFLAGLIYDLTQSYDLAFVLGGALL